MFDHNKLDSYKAILDLTGANALTFNEDAIIFEIGEAYILTLGVEAKIIGSANWEYFKERVAKELLPVN
ncbi:hypothetical protein [Cetobacterium sp.]|uniref:hypothetical protein n=1 Tax=Cetobacterium sp. TaxID=2071632 RepID=UPI003F3AD38D